MLEIDQRKLLPYLFDQEAKEVYEDVAKKYLWAPIELLWDKLEEQLRSEDQLADLYENFFTFQLQERHESPKMYLEPRR